MAWIGTVFLRVGLDPLGSVLTCVAISAGSGRCALVMIRLHLRFRPLTCFASSAGRIGSGRPGIAKSVGLDSRGFVSTRLMTSAGLGRLVFVGNRSNLRFQVAAPFGNSGWIDSV